MRRIEARGTTASLLVVDADTGERVFAHRANARLLPASTMKLVSTHYALAVHGPQFRYQTRAEWLGLRSDIFNGMLVIQASGDPSLGSWRFADDALQKMLAPLDGVREWRGDVVIQGRDGERTSMRGWQLDDEGSLYAAPPTRFVWSENVAEPKLWPRLGWTSTVLPGTDSACRRKGTFVTCWKSVQRVAVADPEQLFRIALEDALKARGIAWKRESVAATQRYAEVVIESPPLSQLVWMTNKHSLNLYAERIAALVSNIPSHGVSIADGSGMSRYNLLTADYLVALLRSGSPELLASLPIAGVDGTLRSRGGKAKGWVFAKTGTLENQRALAGYAVGRRAVWFAFMVNNHPDATNPLLDELMELLTASR